MRDQIAHGLLSIVITLLCPMCVYAGPIKWTFKSQEAGNLVVIGTYPLSEEEQWFSGAYPGGDAPFNGTIGESSTSSRQPTNKRFEFTVPAPGPDPSVSLGVIVGSPGTFTLAELAEGLISLIGFAEYEAPLFGHPTVELFAAVDLSRWLANPSPFNQGDIFTFVNGTNQSLPGYIVGTSPIAFSPSTGWTTANPFTGNAKVIAEVGGAAAIPAPSTITLLTIGAVTLLGYVWRRRKRVTA